MNPHGYYPPPPQDGVSTRFHHFGTESGRFIWPAAPERAGWREQAAHRGGPEPRAPCGRPRASPKPPAGASSTGPWRRIDSGNSWPFGQLPLIFPETFFIVFLKGERPAGANIFPASRGERPLSVVGLPDSRGGRGLLLGGGGLGCFGARGFADFGFGGRPGPGGDRIPGQLAGGSPGVQQGIARLIPGGHALDGRLFHPGAQLARPALGPHRPQKSRQLQILMPLIKRLGQGQNQPQSHAGARQQAEPTEAPPGAAPPQSASSTPGLGWK